MLEYHVINTLISNEKLNTFTTRNKKSNHLLIGKNAVFLCCLAIVYVNFTFFSENKFVIFSLQRSIHCRVARLRPLLKIRIHLLHLQGIKSKKKASEIDRAGKLLILATNSPFNCWFHAFSQFRILKEKK